MDSRELARRANAAWYRFGEGAESATVAHTEVVNQEGRTYVVLASADDVLVVYRVRNDGQLKRLVRIPAWAGGSVKVQARDLFYVIGSSKDRHVQIGSAVDPAKHLARMQAGSPHTLRILLEHAGGSRIADTVKKNFAAFCVRDSWFDFGAANPLILIQQAIKQIEVKS